MGDIRIGNVENHLQNVIAKDGAAHLTLFDPENRLSVQEALDLADKQNLDLATAWRRRAVTLAGIRIARQRPTQLASVAENGEYVQRV